MSWDAIVVGSGIGGLTAAAGLARHGRRVLVLEQAETLGGMTQTFRRQGYRFATGLHYLSGAFAADGGPGPLARLLHALGDGTLRLAPLPARFDRVRLVHPDGGETQFAWGTPESDNWQRLGAAFPAEAAAINAYARRYARAQRDARRILMLHGLPRPAAALLRTALGPWLRRQAGLTLAQALANIRDPALRAILAARGGDYGLPPAQAPLALHALVMGSYAQGGAGYPVGGPERLAASLGATVRASGGELRANACVARIVVERGRAAGVRLADGSEIRARHVISAMGALNTAQALPTDAAPAWQAALRRHAPSLGCITLYLGFDASADALRALGLDGANHWIYDGVATGATPDPQVLLWQQPTDTDAPALYVSFGGLNDPEQAQAPTAEVMALCEWDFFAAWRDSDTGRRPEEYEAVKAWIEDRLLSQFKRLFPALAPHVVLHELSTPLTQVAYARAPRGAMYGLACNPARLLDPALHARTPIPGLLLAGQDVATLGIEGAAVGGLMAAATVQPALWRLLAG